MPLNLTISESASPADLHPAAHTHSMLGMGALLAELQAQGVPSRAVLEGWHGTNDQRANARLRNLAARLRRQAEQRLTEDLDTREIKELTAVLRELMNLQQTLEGQQPGGVVRVELAEETEDWSL